MVFRYLGIEVLEVDFKASEKKLLTLVLLPRRAWRLIPQMVLLLKFLWSRVVGSPYGWKVAEDFCKECGA